MEFAGELKYERFLKPSFKDSSDYNINIERRLLSYKFDIMYEKELSGSIININGNDVSIETKFYLNPAHCGPVDRLFLPSATALKINAFPSMPIKVLIDVKK
ncbi:hypothetical protein [Picrophilus oshimae]|uniref:Uncharacterized protein n=1 Tax=Picrophilus torridus (strain ATCC 700027 / DSM 9790 / JCM 10055 / NBRC 100828 / KAW 2/3) TaxID=1122961 RepID=Q6L0G5_PICTO|nr:hypothetical protein [Picrophilus oshimae]AAT43537.1 hypothetical protein PTO0952 [Picrophilus oshimae DSM 9789]